MALLPVDEALKRILEGAAPKTAEWVPIAAAAGRVLAAPVHALRTQPPFPASAMDGYAVVAADTANCPASLEIIGTAPAGAPFQGSVAHGQAVRIFTGAPIPDGADAVVIQENTTRPSDAVVQVLEPVGAGRHVRRMGLDFVEGDMLVEAGRAIDATAISLAAAGNNARLQVVGRPLVAIIATGDELLPPGSNPGPGQIIASNSYGMAALAQQAGADVINLGIVPDSKDAIAATVRRALAEGADVIVTLGGASVGDHDLVQDVLAGEGMALDFWKIAMRPGKPLMFGRLAGALVLGLPGNPVSSIICAILFLKPLLARLGGRQPASDVVTARLSTPMPANDQRQDYVRARIVSADGDLVATPFATQDSSMLRPLAAAQGLVIRPPFAPAAAAGANVQVLMLR